MFFKSLIATGLILVLFSPPIWVGGWYFAERTSVRREVKSQLIKGVNPEDLVLFSFTKEELKRQVRWEREDEFEYRGKMYDVVRSEENGNVSHYWCWPDEPESLLNLELKNRTAELFNNSPQPREQSGKVILFFKSLFFNETLSWTVLNLDELRAHYQFLLLHYRNPDPVMPYSPPKSA